MARELSRRATIIALVSIGVLFVVLSVCGITWGLPSRDIDDELFSHGETWSGETIYRLAHAAEKFDKMRGADVDADPLDKTPGQQDSVGPILLTGTDEDRAKIYLRYRLYTYQPDEMITMMALAGMSPGTFDFDPRLYQYGGLFIYPVGGLIKLCDVLGLIDVRSDVVYYLDHPEEFGKFYLVARAYAAAWGLLGMLIVFAVAKRLAADGAAPRTASTGVGAGLLAALLFTFMPVVVCMTHEGKPHLPGAVLMLAAVWFGMRHLDRRRARSNGSGHGCSTLRATSYMSDQECRPSGVPEEWGTRRNCLALGPGRDWLLMCLCCGAALGMVLSSGPIFVLIPLVAWLSRGSAGETSVPVGGAVRLKRFAAHTGAGLCIAFMTYLICNPYVAINALFHRDVLRSNLGNSFAMYQIDRLGEGLWRVLELTAEGVTLPILILGSIAVIGAWRRRHMVALPLLASAGVFFLQFVLIGADKPGEYGRFGIFPNAALVIATACLLASGFRRRTSQWLVVVLVAVWTGFGAYGYLYNFHVDTHHEGSRSRLHRNLDSDGEGFITTRWAANTRMGLIAEPAPYSCPPLPFDSVPVYLFANRSAALERWREEPGLWNLLWTTDTPYSEGTRPNKTTSGLAQPVPITIPGPIAPITPISWANKPIEIRESFAPVAP